MTRLEKDSFGHIEVAEDRLWGAQTQRSLEHFAISGEHMPDELIRALAEVKRACARVNRELGLLPDVKALAIMAAADEVTAGRHAGSRPRCPARRRPSPTSSRSAAPICRTRRRSRSARSSPTAATTT